MKKLNLNDLKVESFVTSINGKKSETVKGGTTAVCASSLPCGTVVVASVVVVSVATIINTVNKDGICNTAAYCGNSHDGGNGCTQVVCSDMC
jgi:hypothetical protein